jgi:hypothetical protein
MDLKPPHLVIMLRNANNVLYNLSVGANLMSASFALTYLGDEPCAPTTKILRDAPQSRLEGLGILHNISIYHDNVEIALDYHVFDIQNFDIMIGHPLEKLTMEPLASGNLDIKLGIDTFSIPIT